MWYELLVHAAIEGWYVYSLPLRFALTFWALLAFMYISIRHYEWLNKLIPPRTVMYHNWPIFRVFPITFLMFGLYQWVSYANIAQPTVPLESLYYTSAMILGFGLTSYGLAYALAGRVAMNGHWGTKIYVYTKPEDKKIISRGIYKHMRHPIYLGQFLMALGTWLISNDYWFIIFPLAIGTSNICRSISETHALRDLYGNEFEDYRKKTAPVGFVLLPLGKKLDDGIDSE